MEEKAYQASERTERKASKAYDKIMKECDAIERKALKAYHKINDA